MVKRDEEFTFETITQVFREERNSTTLTRLPTHFYQNLANYMEDLRENYLKQRNDDLTSSKTMMLEDEYNKAQRRVSQIYEYRERKLALLALSAVNGGSPNLKLMTEEEKNAFDALVDTLSKNRSHILLKKEEDACEPKTFLTPDQKPLKTETANEVGDIDVSNTEEEMKVKLTTVSSVEDDQQENLLLLILEDIPSFETEEMSLNLKKNDVILLPSGYAKILCREEKARVIQSNEQS